ncbi:MAG: hypothetical protein M1814_005670 [Vezdaea aestivalis]|nr:MAG: hypothetical protein M1814_005670 [Vezdaea aestivalis]
MLKKLKSLRIGEEKGKAPVFHTGLETLYSGEQGGEVVDIVFIHGLNGNRSAAWTAPGATAPWPQTLLPASIPQARIMTFGYDADVVKWKAVSTNRIRNHATNLLIALSNHREIDGTNRRPIIFVAHSFGGLVCEDALLASWTTADKHQQKIGEFTRAILFIGTPHLGTKSVSWMVPVAKSIGFVKQTNHQILQTIEQDSEVLARIQADFHTTIRKRAEHGDAPISITCFYEELPSPGVGILVAKNCATLAGYDSIGIYANHEGMTKFKDASDPGYRSIRDRLMIAVKQSTTPADRRRYNISIAHSQTCNWIFKADYFRQWKDRERLSDFNGVLWIKGKPGVGKSTLMKHIFGYCEKKLKDHNISSYFFNARGSALEKTFLGMLRSLLYNLLVGDALICEQFRQFCLEKKRKHGNELEWRLGELRELTANFILNHSSRPILLFVDALDECDESEVRQTVQFLESLSIDALKNQVQLSICLSSRHYPTIRMRKRLEIVVESRREHSYDIELYVRDKLQVDDDEIMKKVVDKAENIFLWVILVVELLNRAHDEGDIRALRSRLEEVPRGLDEVFHSLLGKDDGDRKETTLLLLWVLFSKSVFTSTQTLYVAVQSGITPEELGPWDESAQSKVMIERWVVNRSRGLIEKRRRVRSNGEYSIQFIHQSVNDFLLRQQRLQDLDPSLGRCPISASHERLRACCMSYLMIPDLKQAFPEGSVFTMARGQFPFLDRVFHELLFQAEQALSKSDQPIKDSSTAESLKQLLRSPEALRRLGFGLEYDAHHPYSEELGANSVDIFLFYACHLGGLQSLMKWTLEQGANVNAQGGYYGSTLLRALSLKANVSTIKVLLDAGANINAQDGQVARSLQLAVYHDDPAVLPLLLGAGANVNAQGGEDGNALQAAAHSRNSDTVEILLSAGANINAQGGYYGNALQAAARGCGSDIVERLLSAGADVNAQGGYYGNALQAAAAGDGASYIIEMLLSAGADVNAQGGYYGNALQAAAHSRWSGTVEMLLSAGANVNAHGGVYGNALQAAARGGKSHIVEMLLSAGADVNAQGGYYGNALQVAADGGESHIVAMLLSAGADINAQGGVYGNALQAAARGGKSHIVEMLLSAGADVNAQGGYYGNALQAAAYSRNSGTVKILLSAGADVNAQGGYYGTALQAAAADRETLDIIPLLIDKGANVNSGGGIHGSPLNAASAYGNHAIVRILEEYGAVKSTASLWKAKAGEG